MPRNAFQYGCCALAMIALAAPARAQDAADASLVTQPAEQNDVYTPADFARYAPRSALDMLQQIPGFSIEGGGGGGGGGGNQGRGLGQANGNVLLNGQRIVTKSGSINDQLARIAASNVIRIELVEGSTLNIPGLSGRVANVLARSTNGLQGQFEWRPQLPAEYADARWLDGIVSVSGTFGGLGFTVAVEGRPNRNGNGGPNIITYGSGRVEERFSETNSHGDDKRLSGSVRYRTAGGTQMNLNASYLRRRFRSFEDEIVVGPAGAPPLTDEFDQRNQGHDREFGGDIDFALGPGRLKLIGLDSAQQLDFLTQTVIDPATGAAPFGSQFRQRSQRGERIGRGEYSWAMLGADWQWSFEAAFNRLDQQGELFRLVSGAFVPLAFPAGTGGVREDRYESMLSYSRSLTPKLTMQLIAGGEYSSIRQTGSNPNARTFYRPKGSLTLGWAPQQGTSVSLRIDRRVGQLNFGDFLAAVNLSENNQSAGNNELRPDQSWGGELEATRDLGAFGSVTVRGFMRRFEDFVAIIPTVTGGEARGNVAFARVIGIELNGTLKLDPLGVPGAKFDIAAAARDSRYPDPVLTGLFLPVQFAQPHNIDISFRYDMPDTDWAFGAGYRNSGFNPYYRVAEYGIDYTIDQNVQVFVENKDVFGLTVQARVSNLLEREAVLDRYVFTGPRGSAPLLFHEDRRRDIGRVVNLTVKGSF